MASRLIDLISKKDKVNVQHTFSSNGKKQICTCSTGRERLRDEPKERLSERLLFYIIEYVFFFFQCLIFIQLFISVLRCSGYKIRLFNK